MDLLFGTEIWAILLIFLFQDFPFLILRVILVVNYRRASSFTLYFFAVKNIILCFTQIYKIILILIEHREHSHVSRISPTDLRGNEKSTNERI